MRGFNLRSLHFDDRDEAWLRLPVSVDLFMFGGNEYGVRGGVVDLGLRVARVGERFTLTGSFEAVLVGPCERCLVAMSSIPRAGFATSSARRCPPSCSVERTVVGCAPRVA
jgi:hypothetical protein